VAREFGIRDELPTRWKREARSQGKVAFGGTRMPRDEDLAQLKRELARFYKGKKTWTGTIEPDGSVVWDTVGGFFGVSGDPFRIRLRDGKLVYEYVFIRDGLTYPH
jgi:transposase